VRGPFGYALTVQYSMATRCLKAQLPLPALPLPVVIMVPGTEIRIVATRQDFFKVTIKKRMPHAKSNRLYSTT
jgi:hypothetical protein